MYFHFTDELSAFNSFFSPWSMQIQYFNAYLRQYGPWSHRTSYLVVLLCQSTLVFRWEKTSFSWLTTSKSQLAKKGNLIIQTFYWQICFVKVILPFTLRNKIFNLTKWNAYNFPYIMLVLLEYMPFLANKNVRHIVLNINFDNKWCITN